MLLVCGSSPLGPSVYSADTGESGSSVIAGKLLASSPEGPSELVDRHRVAILEFQLWATSVLTGRCSAPGNSQGSFQALYLLTIGLRIAEAHCDMATCST